MIKVDWKHWAAVAVTVAGGAVALYLGCRFALVLLLPFLLALLLAVITRRAVLRISARTGCSERIVAFVVTALALTVLGLAVFLLCSRLVAEVQNLLEFLEKDSADPGGQTAQFIAFFRDFGARFPVFERLRGMRFLEDLLGDPQAYFAQRLQELLNALTGRIATGVGEVLRRLPKVLFFLVFTVISCFYFSVEYETVTRALMHLLPKKVRERVPEWKARGMHAAKRYLRAYLLLFLLTLAELLVGFFLLRIRYAFLLAFFTALLDILPVLGVGVILVPFAVFSLVVGKTARGVWLLVLYAVITIVRQVAEPHLVGKSLGLHPILMLVSLYVGLGVFGVSGFLIGPAIALCAKAVFDFQKETKKGTH